MHVINKWVIEAVVAGLLVLLGMVFGYFIRDHFATASIAAANASLDTCTSAATAQSAALGAVQKRLQQLQADHDAMREAAALAIAGRDEQITRLTNEARTRSRAISETVHADPDCQALARQPVCPAVARRLWGDPQGAGAPPGR